MASSLDRCKPGPNEIGMGHELNNGADVKLFSKVEEDVLTGQNMERFPVKIGLWEAVTSNCS